MSELALAHGALEAYVSNANEVIKFKLIREDRDIEDNTLEFEPEFTHQFFGDSESIFGFKGLSIDIYYTASGLYPFFRMNYTDKVNPTKSEGVQADDVLKTISQKLEMQFLTNIDTFVSSLHREENFKPCGKHINSFEITNEVNETSKYSVYQVDMNVPGFRDYHERVQTFLLWFIDAASYIDVDDEKWEYFVLYQSVTNNGNTQHYFVGYTTVYRYYAYPFKLRPRISQMLILPPFQKQGLGAEMLQTIYDWYISDSRVLDITVEDPSENFVRLRDFVDCKNCMKLHSFREEVLSNGFTEEMAKESQDRFKICKKQAKRVYEILRLKATNKGDKKVYKTYRLEVKKRLNAPYQRQKLDTEKLKKTFSSEELKATMSCITTEQRIEQLDRLYKDLEAEYSSVIERLSTML